MSDPVYQQSTKYSIEATNQLLFHSRYNEKEIMLMFLLLYTAATQQK